MTSTSPIPVPDFGDSNRGSIDAGELLDAALTAAAYDVDGVTDVFAPTGIVAQLPQIVGALVTADPERVNRVRVLSGRDGTSITARIGIDRAASAPEAAREVAAALLEAAPPGAEVAISVQVSRIA